MNEHLSGGLIDPSIVSDMRRLEFRARRTVDSDLMGQYRSAFRGTGLVYSDLREYQPGDDVKHIHWRATARSGRVFVKSYQEDRMLQIMVLADISRSTLFGFPFSRHRRAFEFASLVSMLGQKNGDAVGLCLFSDRVYEFIKPKRSRTHTQRLILSLLASRSLKAGSNLSMALETARQHFRKRGIVFVVSDFHCAPYETELRRLSMRHDVVVVYLEGPSNEEIPDAGIVEYTDAETGEEFLFDTSSRRARVNLTESLTAHKNSIRQIAARSGADFMSIKQDPLGPLVELMKRRTARMNYSFHRGA